MSFLNDVILPNSDKAPAVGGGSSSYAGNSSFLKSVVMPTDQTGAIKRNQDASDAQVLEQNAQHAASIGGIVSSAISDLNSQLPPASTKINSWNPVDWFKQAVLPEAQKLKTTVDATGESILNVGDVAGGGKLNVGNTAIAEAQVVDNSINTVIGGAMGGLNVLSHIPIIGYAVDGLNKLIGALSKGNAMATGPLVQALPISQDQKDKIKPLVVDALTLFLAGKAGDIALKTVGPKIADKTAQIIDTVKKDPNIEKHIPIKSESPAEPTPVPISTPQSRLADYSKAQGYEPYTPPEKLPVIDAGPAAKSKLPIIQVGDKAAPKVKGDITYEPVVPNGFLKSVVRPTAEEKPITVNPTSNEKAQVILDRTNASLKTNLSQAEKPVTVAKEVIPQQGTGKEVAKSASDINQTLVEAGFKAMSDKELAKFTPADVKENKKAMDTFLQNQTDKIYQILDGTLHVPEDIHPQVFFNTLEELAKKTNDARLLQALGRSHIATQLSEAAQSMSMHGHTDNPNAINIARELSKINKAREEVSKPKQSNAQKELKKQLAKETAKVKPKKQNLQEFIDGLTC